MMTTELIDVFESLIRQPQSLVSLSELSAESYLIMFLASLLSAGVLFFFLIWIPIEALKQIARIYAHQLEKDVVFDEKAASWYQKYKIVNFFCFWLICLSQTPSAYQEIQRFSQDLQHFQTLSESDKMAKLDNTGISPMDKVILIRCANLYDDSTTPKRFMLHCINTHKS